MLMARVLFAFLFVFIVTPCSFAAEIININYKYKIAFTDMTENEVRPGDFVSVALSDGKTVRLKVLETFPVMAKLTIADGDQAGDDRQFASIVVGSAVLPWEQAGRGGRTGVKKTKFVPEVDAAPKTDIPAGIETYSPGVHKEEPVARLKVMEREPVVEGDSSDRGRMVVLEQRLDQMMAHNVKLAESITQLLAEKNAAESLARTKEADTLAARKKANELADVNVALDGRIQALTASVDVLTREKEGQQKEIEALNVRLGELKKKLAKMVDIVNTNMKAYEKQ